MGGSGEEEGWGATFGVCTHSLIVLLYGSMPSTSQPSGTSRRWVMMMVIMVLQPRRPALRVHAIPKSGTSKRWAMMMVIMVLLTLVAVGWVQVAGMRNVSSSAGPYLSQPSGM